VARARAVRLSAALSQRSLRAPSRSCGRADRPGHG
jgi:hypothetical protein